MNNEDIQAIANYISCKPITKIIDDESGDEVRGKLIGVMPEVNDEVVCKKGKVLLLNDMEGNIRPCKGERAKPKLILRPIEDITEEEVAKLMEISHRGTEQGSIDYIIEHFDMKGSKFNVNGGDYLRSQGIDIPYKGKTLKERNLAIYESEPKNNE